MEEKDKTCKHCKCDKSNAEDLKHVCDCCESDEEYECDVAEAMVDSAIEALDIESFDAGVAEFSKLCGKIAALGMVGVEPAQALAYISECEDRGVTFDNNMRVAKMQTDAQVAVAKCGMTATLS